MVDHHVRERGSALLLLPAVVLVLCALAAMAVDLSAAFLGERRVSSLADGAANDAASALDEDRWRANGELAVDCGRAARLVEAARVATAAGGLDDLTVDLVSCDGARVTVAVAARVPYAFARGIPGAPHHARVDATSTAEARAR